MPLPCRRGRRIAQMVRKVERAWHAGQSRWAGETDLNSCSIGIEIHNPGHDIDYRDFPEAQMQAVEVLCLDILRRHAIRPERVIAHSDIAPGRKRDPGEKFDSGSARAIRYRALGHAGAARRRSWSWCRRRRAGGPEPSAGPFGIRLWGGGDQHLWNRAREGGRGLSATLPPGAH